jgi:hypothetical protein
MAAMMQFLRSEGLEGPLRLARRGRHGGVLDHRGGARGDDVDRQLVGVGIGVIEVFGDVGVRVGHDGRQGDARDGLGGGGDATGSAAREHREREEEDSHGSLWVNGARNQARTGDPLLTRQALCQLSYTGERGAVIGNGKQTTRYGSLNQVNESGYMAPATTSFVPEMG